MQLVKINRCFQFTWINNTGSANFILFSSSLLFRRFKPTQNHFNQEYPHDQLLVDILFAALAFPG